MRTHPNRSCCSAVPLSLSGFLPALLLSVLSTEPRVGAAAEVQDVFTDVARVVAVGDVHGDYDKFVAVLRLCGLIDQNNAWIGGKSHLVQTGDVLDRGPESRKVMDLLMQLETAADKAGGGVHALIGNHEYMNVMGDLRYVSDGELAALGDPPRGAPLGFPPVGACANHRAAFAPTGKYGRWLLGHNAIVKINDTLFMHSGLSPKYAGRDLHQLNDAIRKELLGKEAGSVGGDPQGPLWYRGLAESQQLQVLIVQLAQIFVGQKAARIVMGHTIQERGITLREGGKLALIDVGMSRGALNAAPACLIIERTAQGDRLTVRP